MPEPETLAPTPGYVVVDVVFVNDLDGRLGASVWRRWRPETFAFDYDLWTTTHDPVNEYAYPVSRLATLGPARGTRPGAFVEIARRVLRADRADA